HKGHGHASLRAGEGDLCHERGRHLHVASHITGQYHHSSLLAGANVACAGEIEIGADGKILWLSNKSGHYKPNVDHVFQVLNQLQKHDKVTYVFRLTIWGCIDPMNPGGPQTRRDFPGAAAFLAEQEPLFETDYQLNKLMAYLHHFIDPGR